MLQSMLALPLSAAAAVLLFALLHVLSPMNGKQVAVVVALVSLASLLIYSLIDWPGGDVLAMYVAVLLVTAYLLGIISHAREARGAAATGRETKGAIEKPAVGNGSPSGPEALGEGSDPTALPSAEVVELLGRKSQVADGGPRAGHKGSALVEQSGKETG